MEMAAKSATTGTGATKLLYSNDPPAEPEAFRLLAPQRGLFAAQQKLVPDPGLRIFAHLAQSGLWMRPQSPEIT